MEHISTLFGDRVPVLNKKTRATERGELLKTFAQKTGRAIPYIAYRLTGIPTADLYFIEKQCSVYAGPYAKAFFGMLRVRKTEEKQ